MTVRLREDVRRAVLRTAAVEASRRGSARIGTQDLLLAALDDPTSQAGRILETDLAQARAAVDALDRTALASVGVDLGEVALAPAPIRGGRRRPLTAGARAVLTRAVRQARSERARRIDTRHLVVALLGATRGDPAVDVLDALGVDREQARRRAAP
jgi:ATP-dependent Clp protease ATP-binding subunit ClpA